MLYMRKGSVHEGIVKIYAYTCIHIYAYECIYYNTRISYEITYIVIGIYMLLQTRERERVTNATSL